MEKKYQDELAKVSKHELMYRERQEILGEEISLLEQDAEDSQSKKKDFEVVEKKFGLLEIIKLSVKF